MSERVASTKVMMVSIGEGAGKQSKHSVSVFHGIVSAAARFLERTERDH